MNVCSVIGPEHDPVLKSDMQASPVNFFILAQKMRNVLKPI